MRDRLHQLDEPLGEAAPLHSLRREGRARLLDEEGAAMDDLPGREEPKGVS